MHCSTNQQFQRFFTTLYFDKFYNFKGLKHYILVTNLSFLVNISIFKLLLRNSFFFILNYFNYYPKYYINKIYNKYNALLLIYKALLHILVNKSYLLYKFFNKTLSPRNVNAT